MAEPKKLKVLLHGELVGELSFDARTYTFSYVGPQRQPLSLSLPLEPKHHDERADFGGRFNTLPHYFENLLPEGWLMDVAKSMRRVEPADKLDMLFELCRDTIGAVSFARESDGGNDAAEVPTAPFAGGVTRPGTAQGAPTYDLLHCGICARRLPNRGYNGGFHEACAGAFFGSPTPPTINVDRQNLRRVAEEHLARGESITGSQEKFSLKYSYRDKAIIVPGYSFIVKPLQAQHPEICDLPRTEHVVTRLAAALGLGVAETAFIKLGDGTDAFITRRFDRDAAGGRIHAEDLAQATGQSRASEGRYHGSHELIAKTLADPLADQNLLRVARERFLRATLFNYIFGNTVAHLKNHSIIWGGKQGETPSFTLAPLYDLVPCLLYTKDQNELGLKLGGKNSRLTRGHFDELAAAMKLGHGEIPSFIAEVREKRQLLIGLMRAYEVGDDKIRALTDLAAQRIQVIEDKSGRRARAPMAEPAAAQRVDEGGDKRADGGGGALMVTSGILRPAVVGSQAPGAVYCRSMPCKNPNGPTELRGRRKISGVCSYCKPEVR
jgi:serine/threonine-protein kinase HipA